MLPSQTAASIDINGKACSIELYLGQENLKNTNGNFYPVKWTCFKSEVGTHQGDLGDNIKMTVQDRFLKLLESKNKEDINFQEMKILIEKIFSIFDA